MAGGMSTSEMPDHRPGREPLAGAAPDRRARAEGGGDLVIRQIGDEAQRRAVAHLPMRGEQAVVGRLGVAEAQRP